MNFAHFCEFWCFSFGKQARFTLNFCSGMAPGKVHELAFLWFGLPGRLLKKRPKTSPKMLSLVQLPTSFHRQFQTKFRTRFFGRGEKTPTPKTRFSTWTLLRTPGRFTTRRLPVYFTTKMSVVRPFSVLSRPLVKRAVFLGRNLGGGGLFPSSKFCFFSQRESAGMATLTNSQKKVRKVMLLGLGMPRLATKTRRHHLRQEKGT